ncbi:unnamed protein product, partial [Meganyctiphanes norvegica]
AAAMEGKSMEVPSPSLPVWLRLYIYGIHGFMTEVLFTAAWDLAVYKNPQLPGCTSVWSFLIYSTSVFAIEKFYRQNYKTVPLLLRCILYVLWTYIWEFSTGLLLRQFNACPWDYTERSYNFMGLITLEYAPAWFFAGLLTDQVLIKNIMYLKFATPYDSSHNHNMPANLASAIHNGHIKTH